MLIKRSEDIPSSDITPESTYLNRRKFIAGFGLGGALGSSMIRSQFDSAKVLEDEFSRTQKDWSRVRSDLDEELNSYEDVTTYNNFYEFGTGKDDPAKNSHTLKPHPWTIEVDGLCAKRGTYGLEEFIKPRNMEDRVYRLRCVEAWSMVIPWYGFSLKEVIDWAEPLGSARYIEFTSLYNLEQMPMQRSFVLEWPYVEGLRLDEARHPLTILVTGVYGRELPNQNGAPLRLIVPWKYGFKGIKSIVKIRFTETQPLNTWQQNTPREYGFYANVNPGVDHPRWSQARERRLGELRKRPTLMFNGYGEQVASLYSGMDLRLNF